MINFQQKMHEIFNKPKQFKQIVIKVQEKEKTTYTWAVCKRSLPVGLDSPVLFNLTEKEANMWIKRLKPKLVHYDHDKDIRVVHYYEKVRSDGYLAGIYENGLL